MRVLWFVNRPVSPASVESQNASQSGGWLEGLASAISEEIDLSVAYVDPYGPLVTKGKRLTSYALRPKHWRMRLLARSVFNVGLDEGPLLQQMRRVVETVSPDLVDIHGTEKSFGELLTTAPTGDPPMLLTLQGVLGSLRGFFDGGYDSSFLRSFFYDRGARPSSLFPKRLMSRRKHLRRQAQREWAYIQAAKFVSGRTGWDRRIALLVNPAAQYFHVDRVLRSPFYTENWSSPERASPIRVHTTLGDSLAKGLDVIAEASVRLLESGIDVEWSVAGVSDSSMSALAARRKLGRRFPETAIRLCGRLGPSALVREMQSAHVYVMASFMENSPNSLAEAMILGMPCVATFAGGSGSYIRDGENGLLVQPGDALGLAAAVAHLVRNPQEARELGARARDTARQRHDPVRAKTQLLAAYTAVAGRKVASASDPGRCQGG